MNRVITLAILFLAALATGCASITRGTKDAFAIQSTPSGAMVSMSNGLNCVTPCAIELPRKHGFSVTFTLDGYKTLTTNVIPKQAGAGSAGMAGNVILGGLIGAAVDLGTGAMKDLYPNPLIVTLVPNSSSKASMVEVPEGKTAEVAEAADDGESTPKQAEKEVSTPKQVKEGVSTTGQVEEVVEDNTESESEQSKARRFGF